MDITDVYVIESDGRWGHVAFSGSQFMCQMVGVANSTLAEWQARTKYPLARIRVLNPPYHAPLTSPTALFIETDKQYGRRI